jgi:hypothetical protein
VYCHWVDDGVRHGTVTICYHEQRPHAPSARRKDEQSRRSASQLDSDSKTKGTQFEHLTKWFLENDRRFRHHTQVWLGTMAGRWGGDAGIKPDRRRQQGTHVGDQSKACKATYSIKKRDVDTFLSESNRVVISHRLLIATTDRIERPANGRSTTGRSGDVLRPHKLEKSRSTGPPRYRSSGSATAAEGARTTDRDPSTRW